MMLMSMDEKTKRMTDEAFIELCKEGSAAEVREAISNGADVNARNDEDKTPLRVACGWNNVDVVKVLLENGANPNAKYFESWTLLMFIAANDEIDLEIFKMLLDAGADVNAKSEYSHTALCRAIQHSGRIDVIKLLLEDGADVSVPCPYGADFFEHGGGDALESSLYNPEIFKLVLQYGGDINQENGALLRNSAAHGRKDEVKMLLEAGMDVNAKDQRGITPLLAVVTSDRGNDKDKADIVNLLLDAGADPNVTYKGLYPIEYVGDYRYFHSDIFERLKAITEAPNPADRTSPENLMQLIKYNHLETPENIRAAVAAGADVNAKDSDGNKPMQQALLYAPIETSIIQTLLDVGVDVNDTDWGYDNDTYLMLAVSGRHNPSFHESNYHVIKMLLDAGANVNARNESGGTALMIAVSHRHPETIRLLLNAGANVNAKDDEGHTALMSAVHSENPETIKLLLDAGADATVQAKDGETALTALLSKYNFGYPRNRVPIIKLLVDAGADINAQGPDSGHLSETFNGRTPLMMAVSRNYPENVSFEGCMAEIDMGPELVKTILDAGADVNMQDPEGWTALMIAAHVEKPHAEIINLLLDAGANVDVEHEGLRAFDYLKASDTFVDGETIERLEKLTNDPSPKRYLFSHIAKIKVSTYNF